MLSGLDDGPTSHAESVAMAVAAAAEGIRVIAATPHLRHDYPQSTHRIRAARENLAAALRGRGAEVEIVAGAEVAVTALTELDRGELLELSLGGSERYVLVETPYTGWPLNLDAILDELAADGFAAVLAHPERSGAVQRRPQLVRDAVRRGALVQVNARALTRPRAADGRAARRLLDAGLVHLVASDGHDLERRPISLRPAFEALDEPRARWLTEEVPAAIVAGDPPPRPPRQAPKRRWLRARAHRNDSASLRNPDR